MKKIKMFASLSAVCCLLPGMLSAMPASAVKTAAEVPDGLTYEITADNTVTIKKWTGDAPSVEVPAEIEGLPVTAIGRSAFQFNKTLEEITLPDTITEIGKAAFTGCSMLKEIDIPDSVTRLNEMMFSDCYRLERVKLPASLETAGDLMFNSCVMLEEIILPEGVTLLESGCFSKCSAVRRVVVPAAVTKISYHAMATCEQLASVVIENPDCVIEDSAETISSGINRETEEPFFDGVIYGYEGSTAETYAEKYGYAFAPIAELPAEEQPAPENLQKGLCFVRQNDHIVITKWYGLDEELTVPDELCGLPVTAVDGHALTGFASAKKITVPDSVTEIGEYAFASNKELTEVRLPKTLTEMSDGLFSGCAALENITIPDSVTTIGKHALSSCNSLISVTVPDSVTMIAEFAFSDSKNLEQVVLPNTDITISEFAFSDCTALSDIRFPDHAPILNPGVLRNTGLRTFTIPETVTAVERHAFRACKKLEEITVPAAVESIGTYAFQLCPLLNTITILNPDCVIEDDANTICNESGNYKGVIRGYAGSTAEAYAEKYGYTFEVIEGSPNPNPFLLGDVNFDGSVDAADAQITLTAYLETLVNKPLGLTDRQILAADIDTDNTVTASDAQFILIYYLRNTVSKIPTTWEALLSEASPN